MCGADLAELPLSIYLPAVKDLDAVGRFSVLSSAYLLGHVRDMLHARFGSRSLSCYSALVSPSRPSPCQEVLRWRLACTLEASQ